MFITLGTWQVDLLPMPALLLDVGFVLLALALFRYARVLGELMAIIQMPPIEGWVRLAGWLLIFTFSIPHYISNAVFYANLSANQNAYFLLWAFRTFSTVGLLLAAIFALTPSVWYYYRTSR